MSRRDVVFWTCDQCSAVTECEREPTGWFARYGQVVVTHYCSALCVAKDDGRILRQFHVDRATEKHETPKVWVSVVESGILQQAIASECAAVVAWLRASHPGLGTGCRGEIKRCADAIEIGEHRR